MGYETASTAEVESVMPEEWGGFWYLKDPLDTRYLGVSIMELEPGGKGKAHDERDTGQEEVYCVVEGRVDVDLDGETVTLGPNEALRLDPEERRQIVNRGDEYARLVLVGGPR